EQRQAALDLVWDKRSFAEDGRMTHDPLAHLLEVFSGVDTAATADARAAELAAMDRGDRLAQRTVDGEMKGLTEDLDAGLARGWKALDIVNDHLLAGMKVVGERFGAGQMQLPFVLQSAETMKAAVAHLEPHMEKVDGGEGPGKG